MMQVCRLSSEKVTRLVLMTAGGEFPALLTCITLKLNRFYVRNYEFGTTSRDCETSENTCKIPTVSRAGLSASALV